MGRAWPVTLCVCVSLSFSPLERPSCSLQIPRLGPLVISWAIRVVAILNS